MYTAEDVKYELNDYRTANGHTVDWLPWDSDANDLLHLVFPGTLQASEPFRMEIPFQPPMEKELEVWRRDEDEENEETEDESEENSENGEISLAIPIPDDESEEIPLI